MTIASVAILFIVGWSGYQEMRVRFALAKLKHAETRAMKAEYRLELMGVN